MRRTGDSADRGARRGSPYTFCAECGADRSGEPIAGAVAGMACGACGAVAVRHEYGLGWRDSDRRGTAHAFCRRCGQARGRELLLSDGAPSPCPACGEVRLLHARVSRYVLGGASLA